MKKLFVLLTSTLLFACSSGPSLDQLAAQMPKDNRSVMLQVPEAGNPVSNGMLVATRMYLYTLLEIVKVIKQI